MAIGVYSHHEAKYNLRMIFENLLLIEDHLKVDPCANCLTKHLNLILAYSHEGRGLDGAAEVMGLFDEMESSVPEWLETVLSCSSGGVCDVKEPEKMQRMIQSIRRLRRVVGAAVFGIDSDIVHDISEDEEKENERDWKVEQSFEFQHENPHEVPA